MAPSSRSKSQDGEKEDVSQLRKPITIHGKPVEQILNSIHYGSPELRSLLLYECDIIFECKLCRALFRDLPNFIAHKRKYCTKSIDEVYYQTIGQLPDERVVVVHPQSADEPLQSGAQQSHQSQINGSGPSQAFSVYDDAAAKLQHQKDHATITSIRTHTIPTNSNAVFMDVHSTCVNVHDRHSVVRDSCRAMSPSMKASRKAGDRRQLGERRGLRSNTSKKSSDKPNELTDRLIKELRVMQNRVKNKSQPDNQSGSLNEAALDSNKSVVLEKVIPRSQRKEKGAIGGDGEDDPGVLKFQKENVSVSKGMREEIKSKNNVSVSKASKGMREEIKLENDVSDAVSQGETSSSKKHLRSQNKAKSLICHKCGSIFSSRKSLLFHVKTYHSTKTTFFPCPICSNVYYYFSAVTRHMQINHKKSNKEVNAMRHVIKSSAFSKPLKSETADTKTLQQSGPFSSRTSLRHRDKALGKPTNTSFVYSLIKKSKKDLAKKDPILENADGSFEQQTSLEEMGLIAKESKKDLRLRHSSKDSNSDKRMKAMPISIVGIETKKSLGKGFSMQRCDKCFRLFGRKSTYDCHVKVCGMELGSDRVASGQMVTSRGVKDESSNFLSPGIVNGLQQEEIGREVKDMSESKMVVNEQKEVRKQRQVVDKGKEVVSEAIKFVSGDEEVVSEEKDVSENEDKVSEQKDISEEKYVVSEEKEVSVNIKLVSGDEEIMSEVKDISEQKEVVSEGIEIFSEPKDVSEDKEVVSDNKEVVSDDKEGINGDNDVSDDETVARKVEGVSGDAPCDHDSTEGSININKIQHHVTSACKASDLKVCDTRHRKSDTPMKMRRANGVKMEEDEENLEDSANDKDSVKSFESGFTATRLRSAAKMCNPLELSGRLTRRRESTDLSSMETSSVSGASVDGDNSRASRDSSGDVRKVLRKTDVNRNVTDKELSVEVPIVVERPRRKRKVPSRNIGVQEFFQKMHRGADSDHAPIEPCLGKLGPGYSSSKDLRVSHDASVKPEQSNSRVEKRSNRLRKHVSEMVMSVSRTKTRASKMFVLNNRGKRDKLECYNQSNVDKFIDEKNIRCLQCGAKFTSVFSLKRHIVRCHFQWRRFQCKLCPFQSFDRSECKTHIVRNHKRGMRQASSHYFNSLMIDLVKKGSKAMALKKNATMRVNQKQQRSEGVEGNLYRNQKALKVPRLAERKVGGQLTGNINSHSEMDSVDCKQDRYAKLVLRNGEGEGGTEISVKETKEELPKTRDRRQCRESGNELTSRRVAGSDKNKTVLSSYRVQPVSHLVRRAVEANSSPRTTIPRDNQKKTLGSTSTSIAETAVTLDALSVSDVSPAVSTACGSLNSICLAGKRAALPFNISTRKSPRVFDTTPYNRGVAGTVLAPVSAKSANPTTSTTPTASTPPTPVTEPVSRDLSSTVETHIIREVTEVVVHTRHGSYTKVVPKIELSRSKPSVSDTTSCSWNGSAESQVDDADQEVCDDDGGNSEAVEVCDVDLGSSSVSDGIEVDIEVQEESLDPTQPGMDNSTVLTVTVTDVMG